MLAKQPRKDLTFFGRYARDRLVFDHNLSVPVRVIFKDHRNWAGKDALPANIFMACLRETGVDIVETGKGRLKRVAHGVGVRPL